MKLILPGAVDTEIWDHPDAEPSTYTGPNVPATEVAAGIADAIDGDRFEHYLPDMKSIAQYKTAEIDDHFQRSIEVLDGWAIPALDEVGRAGQEIALGPGRHRTPPTSSCVLAEVSEAVQKSPLRHAHAAVDS